MSCLMLPPIADKAGLLQAFATYCDFTAGFGHNWDALWDSLNDWLAQQSMPFCLMINGQQVQQLDQHAWQQCRQILDDACSNWPGFSYQLKHMPSTGLT